MWRKGERMAVTGGIGSGKSYVCKLLERRGINVYDCDAAAKRLMRTSLSLRRQLQELVGEDVYAGDVLQKSVLAKYILQGVQNRQAVNNVVHPAVAQDFMSSGFTWLESAILFDSGFDKRVPLGGVVCVTAPLELRIERIMHRDSITEAKALDWIGSQMPQEEVLKRSDYEIINDGKNNLETQINNLLIKIKD